MNLKDEATKAGLGAVAGVVSGLANGVAPHFRRMGKHGMFAANTGATFTNAATKSYRAHHKLIPALGVGGVAVAHVAGATLAAAGTVAVAAAPAVAAVAIVSGTAIGAFKLYGHLSKK